jgi:hypothetical protein
LFKPVSSDEAKSALLRDVKGSATNVFFASSRAASGWWSPMSAATLAAADASPERPRLSSQTKRLANLNVTSSLERLGEWLSSTQSAAMRSGCSTRSAASSERNTRQRRISDCRAADC